MCVVSSKYQGIRLRTNKSKKQITLEYHVRASEDEGAREHHVTLVSVRKIYVEYLWLFCASSGHVPQDT